MNTSDNQMELRMDKEMMEPNEKMMEGNDKRRMEDTDD